MAKKKPAQVPFSVDKLNLEYGKVPPHSIELEQAVLGAVLLEKDALLEVIDILSPQTFYKQEHQRIYQAVLDLSSTGRAIDILTVTQELKSRKELDKVGGPLYIAQLTHGVASSAHLDFHARIIAQKYIQRELIRVSSDIQSRAFDDSVDVDDLLDFSESQLFGIGEGNIKKQSQKIDLLIKQAISQIEAASKCSDNLIGVPSGYTQLDRITSGWQNSDLIVVAARPSMGKTAFVLSMARNMAVEQNRAVAFFSLEMSSQQLINRLIVAETNLPVNSIRSGKLSEYQWQQLDHKIQRLTQAPIYIDDTPAISIFELRAKCRRLKRQHNIDVVIIDYLQLMTSENTNRGSREQEVSNISRALKSIAKELDLPVIALSQLNRALEIRSGNKRPQLSDLRESGAIEQDADMVLFLHRPEVYGFTQDENGNSLQNLAEIILAKHRNGPVGEIQLKFSKELAKFSDLEDDILEPIDNPPDLESLLVKSPQNNEKD